MRFVVRPDLAGVVDAAADLVEAAVRDRPELVLGVATGGTPEPLYAELARRAAAGLDLGRLHLTCLDEYVGLGPDHHRSYQHYIDELVVRPWGVDPARVLLPRGDRPDALASASDFGRGLGRLGGIDLQILGLGVNGHIGFNEPGSPLDSGTRVVALTESTRRANARFFDSADQVPTHAITQGLGTIMAARQVVMLVAGESKRAAARAMRHGPVTAEVPASVLQGHPDATILLDRAAA